LFSKLHAGERGIPQLPRTLQVHGHWREGRTMRAAQAVPSSAAGGDLGAA
jgi:hypothetical protein